MADKAIAPDTTSADEVVFVATTAVRLRAGRDSRLQAAAFDSFAHDYDAAFTNSALGRVLRNLVWARADVIFREGMRVLELGCGTGEDAVHFAGRGIDVVATDVSPKMLDVARDKAASRFLSDKVRLHALPMEDVPRRLAGQSFDGVFSNFGAVNCVRDMQALVQGVARMLEPGAPLLWVVMGRHVPWEWIWYGCRGQGRQALRRLRKDGVEWRGLSVRYPTPRQLGAVLHPYFAIGSVSPLGWILPPTYAAGWLNRSPRALAALTRLETAAQRSASLARIADHYILLAHRT